MSSRSLIDTNILVYAEASNELAKQRIALDLLKQLFETTSSWVQPSVE